MSELETYKMVDEKYCTDCVCVIPSWVYLKSEADKVISRHKYKRCLAMAIRCRSSACFYDTMRADSLFWAWKSDRAYKWHKRWLQLAEKFKEAK